MQKNEIRIPGVEFWNSKNWKPKLKEMESGMQSSWIQNIKEWNLECGKVDPEYRKGIFGI